MSLVWVFVLTSSQIEGQPQAASEYEIKAAFLYNFARFVDWPPESFSDAGSPLVVGIVGSDPFGGLLDKALNGKTANGRTLTVRRLSVGQDIRSCHVLFVSSSEARRMEQIADSLRGASVLTVSDMDRFVQLGGIVQLTKDNNRVGLVINAGLAERSRLKLSSKLLSLSKVV